MRTSIIFAASILLLGAASASAQVFPYGPSTPPGFTGVLGSGGQVPVVGNASFKLALQGHNNANGGGMILGFNSATTPVSAALLLVDLAGAVVAPLPPLTTNFPLPVPAIPGIIGFSGYAQAGVFDPALLGGFGLTNGLLVTVLATSPGPTRAYISGQDFSFGANAPGQMAVLDLSVQPPVFRATGGVGFSGNISDNYPNKIAVAELASRAYALGNSTTNQFVRVYDISADPTGVVTHVPLGDIPVAGDIGGSVGTRDMEVTTDGHYLFTITGGGTATLQVFDTSSVTPPTTAIQSMSFPNAGNVCGLELSPNGDRLVQVMSSDSYSTITIYNITPFAAAPLTPAWYLTLGAFAGQYSPGDAHFTPDGQLLFVSGSNGVFNVINTQTSPPTVLIPAGSWGTPSASLWFHGNAVAFSQGRNVAIVGDEGNNASYHVIELDMTSASFGQVIASFSTNTAPGANGNISNHRMHAKQNIVIATDGTGATVDCQWVDVIDLNQPVGTGYQSWRVKMPSNTSLTPSGISCIPRDFDLF